MNYFRKHLKQDLDSYVCLFDGCTQPYSLFSSSKDWLCHMRSEHLVKWTCPVEDDGIEFGTKEQLTQHMHQLHLDIFNVDMLPFIVEACGETIEEVFEACPFCDKTPQTDIEEHIGHHLRYLALKSIPWPENDGEAVSSDTEEEKSSALVDKNVKRETLGDSFGSFKPGSLYMDDDRGSVASEYGGDAFLNSAEQRQTTRPEWVDNIQGLKDERQAEWGFIHKINVQHEQWRADLREVPKPPILEPSPPETRYSSPESPGVEGQSPQDPSPEDSFPENPLPDDFNLVEHINNALRESEFPTPKNGLFAPRSTLRAINNTSVIRTIWPGWESFESLDDSDRKLVEFISGHAPEIFAIGIYMGIDDQSLRDMMQLFMRHDISDRSLPISDAEMGAIWPGPRYNGRRRLFKDSQRLFRAQGFSMRDRFSVIQLQPNIVLPILKSEAISQGQFGIIYKVRLHEEFLDSNDPIRKVRRYKNHLIHYTERSRIVCLPPIICSSLCLTSVWCRKS